MIVCLCSVETMAPHTFSGALTAASDYVENNKKTVAIAAGATSAALVRHPPTDFALAPMYLRASFPNHSYRLLLMLGGALLPTFPRRENTLRGRCPPGRMMP